MKKIISLSEFKLHIVSITDNEEIISYAVVAQCLRFQLRYYNLSAWFMKYSCLMAKRLTQLSHSQILATLTSGETFTLRSRAADQILIPNKMLEQPSEQSTSEHLKPNKLVKTLWISNCRVNSRLISFFVTMTCLFIRRQIRNALSWSNKALQFVSSQ